MTGNYLIRVHNNPGSIDAAAWNDLLESQDAPTPFLRHEVLTAMYRSGSAEPATGWVPCWITLERDSTLHAACPLYEKSHSRGEYVFDWAWADAYRRHGLAYYPKLIGAVPFTPVPGSRLLARCEAARDRLLDAIIQLALKRGLSSAHLLFLSEVDRAACTRNGWMLREGMQFHWRNRVPAPYASFEDFLGSLQRDKRKKILQERRRVTEAGIVLEAVEGSAIDAALWDIFYRCYTLTYRAHGSTPYLSRAFFEEMARRLSGHWLMFVARRGTDPVAASLVGLDPARGTAFGRYWGAVEHVPCLHFEACYYAPLAWCITHGYQRFEGGAQGEHKMARGLLPVRTWSAHWLADARFARAVDEFLAREGAGVSAYLDDLSERNPFRSGAA